MLHTYIACLVKQCGGHREIVWNNDRALCINKTVFPTLKLSRCLYNLTQTYIQVPCTNCIYSNTYRRHLETNELKYTPRHYPLLQTILQRHQIRHSTFFMNWIRVPCSMLQNYCILAKTLQPYVTGIVCTGFPPYHNNGVSFGIPQK
jgi:hypothetical protein